MTFGLKQSTVSLLQNNSDNPNQSHSRIIVPKFPGSLIPSTAIVVDSAKIYFSTGNSNTPKTGLGELK